MRPANVEVTSVTTNSVTLSVTPSAFAPAGTTYIVQTTTATGGSLPDPNPANPTSNTELTIPGLQPGHAYRFMVSGNHADKIGVFTPVNQHTSIYCILQIQGKIDPLFIILSNRFYSLAV